MNLDTLKRGQVTVQDATIVAGQEPKWSRQRGTKLRVHASRVHPRVRDIQININGSMVYFATDWDPKLQALVRYGQATKIVGITGPWREIRHPDHPKDAKAKLAMVVQEAKPMFEGASAMGDGTYDPLLIYLREIGQTPLLNLADERKLARKARKGDPRARELLILANLRLVVHIARGYSNKGLPMADLINEGNLGLMKAVGRFNPRKAKLSTYAAWWIKQHMMRALTNQIRSIRLPVHVVEQLTKLRRAEVVLQERLKREPTPEEIAEVLGITAFHVRRLITAAVTPTSIDAPIGEGETALAELIPDENALDPAESAERSANAKVIQKLMADLPPRERVILEYRFGFDGGKGTTLEEAGQRFGITRERIRQIQAKLLKQLRRSIEKLEDHERNEILKGLKASTAA